MGRINNVLHAYQRFTFRDGAPYHEMSPEQLRNEERRARRRANWIGIPGAILVLGGLGYGLIGGPHDSPETDEMAAAAVAAVAGAGMVLVAGACNTSSSELRDELDRRQRNAELGNKYMKVIGQSESAMNLELLTPTQE